MPNIKIGFTERGDGGRDVDTWLPKVKAGSVDGIIVVTKTLTTKCANALLDLWKDGFRKIILHVTCTGWGESYIEPNAFNPYDQIHAMKMLTYEGFPLKNCVLRIDPIIPTMEGIFRAKQILYAASFAGFFEYPNDVPRIRFSVLDNYPHVRQRFAAAGGPELYDGAFQAPEKDLLRLHMALHEIHQELSAYCSVPYFETCAETFTQKYVASHKDAPFKANVGCLSETDLRIMGFTDEQIKTVTGINPQNRSGCHCLSCKTELLEHRHPCQNGCLYCYWK